MALHLQYMRWTLPAFALIIGLFWYKRRREEHGDPGGYSNQAHSDIDENLKDKFKIITFNPNKSSNLQPVNEPSAINELNSEHSVMINSPRKSTDNLSNQIRRSPPQPIVFTKSVVERHHRSTDWQQSDDDDIIEQLDRTDPVLINKSKREEQDMAAKKQTCEGQDANNQTASVDTFIEENTMSCNKDTAVVAEVEVASQSEKKETKDLEVDEAIGKEVEEEVKKVVVEEDKKKDEANVDECTEDKEEKNGEQIEIRSQVEERDSANHSPVSGVLEGSITDEVRSEGSTDSGKGGSIKGHAISCNQTFYDFCVPNRLVGRLIGRQGSNLQFIRTKTGVKINIRKHKINSDEFSICVVEGVPEAIQMALAHIRKMFPVQFYPNFTMDLFSVIKCQDEIQQIPAKLVYLSLSEGINNDVFVCSVVKPNHLFVHMPTHPAYTALATLDENMTQFYSAYDSPPVPAQLVKGQIVAVNVYNKWLRALIDDPDPNGESTTVRLLDHGGYWVVRHADMRKIRNDYLSLPFQAIEVHLANIKPKNYEWDNGAYAVVQQICSMIGQAQVVAYIDNNTYVNLFFNIHKHGLISLADELVLRGYAERVSLEDMVPNDGWSIV